MCVESLTRGRGSAGHLNRNTATERTSTSGVLASDHADVALASDSSCASHAGRNGSSEGLVLHLGVTVASAVVTRKVLSDSDGLPVGTCATGVDHALVWASTIGVDLVNSHHDLGSVSYEIVVGMRMSYLTTSSDLRKGATVELHNLCSSGLDSIGASTKCLTAGSCGIATEASRVLLEGVAVCSVTRSVGVNTDRRTLATSISSSTDDGAVASHERRRSQKAESNNGRLSEVHAEPVRWIY